MDSIVHFGNVEFLATVEDPDWHFIASLKLSERNPNHLLAAYEGAFMLIDKNTGEVNVIAGHLYERGYKEDIGKAARFIYIRGSVELQNGYLVSDRENFCIRMVNYQTLQTTTFAGKCKNWGHTDGNLQEARMKAPSEILKDPKDSTIFYFLDLYHLRRINLDTQVVATICRFETTPMALVINPFGGLLVSGSYAIVQVNETTGDKDLLAGRLGYASDAYGCSSCPFRSSIFSQITGVLFVTPTVILVSMFYENAIRMLNVTSHEDTPIHLDETPYAGYENGHYTEAKFSLPYSFAMDESYIYIAELNRFGGGLRRMEYSGMLYVLSI